MNASSIGKIAIASIDGYQKYISPRKGFSCAHRHLHGGESCSQYIKQLIAEEGLIAAVRASRQRFAACREANQTLRDLRRNKVPVQQSISISHTAALRLKARLHKQSPEGLLDTKLKCSPVQEQSRDRHRSGDRGVEAL